MGTFIAGMGYHHPQRRVTNEDLVRRMDTSDEWILERTGIRERRYADEGVDTSDLGVFATTKALDDVGWDPTELELLICATSTPDCLVPSTASYICNKMQLPSVALDVNAACSGFVYGLAVAQGLMETSGFGRVALCTAEKYSRVVDPTDRRNAIFWGDSAATVMLQRDPPPVGAELIDVVLKNVNEGADLAKVPIRGYVAVEGNAVKPIADKGFTDSATDILERNRLSTEDLRAFMGHQVNLRVLESLADTLGVNGRHWHNVETLGNQGAAGVVTTFCAGIERHAGELKDGDLFLLTVFGAGFTSGSALLRWVDRRERPSEAG
jgi:3-oxoacyl-[acyl-carrier-protein] synthase-3